MVPRRRLGSIRRRVLLRDLRGVHLGVHLGVFLGGLEEERIKRRDDDGRVVPDEIALLHPARVGGGATQHDGNVGRPLERVGAAKELAIW